jgi:hypothetical protein
VVHIQANWSASISIPQHRPDNLEREPLPFKKPRQPTPAGFAVEGLHRIQFLLDNLLCGLALGSVAENLGKDFPDDILADPLIPKFLSYPAPAESPMPDPAPRPLMRKLQVIHITEPHQVGKNGTDYRIIKFLIMKLCLDLRPAPGAIGEKTVGRIFSAGVFLVIHVTAPNPSLHCI